MIAVLATGVVGALALVGADDSAPSETGPPSVAAPAQPAETTVSSAASAGGVDVRLELPTAVIPSGGSVEGVVVIENRTEETFEVTGCGRFFDVVLQSDAVASPPVWRACRQPFTLPVGVSRWPVAVVASSRTCQPDQAALCRVPPALPAGSYRATLVQPTDSLPAPPPIDVRVT